MQYKIKLIAFILFSVYSCKILAQDSASISNKVDRNLLTEVYDGTYTVTNEVFNAKLVGVYMDDCPELFSQQGSREYYYDNDRYGGKILNFYTVDQFTVAKQLPMDVYWATAETDKFNFDWKKENTLFYQGAEAPSWFTFEFLRGKLLTIKADSNTSRDFLFSGFSKHDRGKLGAQGMNLNFTSDDEKQFIIETLIGKDDEVYLVLTPTLMEALSMGSLTTGYQGEIQYYYDGRWRSDDYARRYSTKNRFFRPKSYWSIVINETNRSTSYSKVPTALLFKLELVE